MQIENVSEDLSLDGVIWKNGVELAVGMVGLGFTQVQAPESARA